MLDTLKEKLQQYNNATDKYNYLREYLQLLVLKIIDEKGYFRNLAFVGGTALRILYDLKRFSEDLDFSLINNTNFSFVKMMDVITKELEQQNLSVSCAPKDDKTVSQAFIKFDQLLYTLNLSNHKDQKLSIKIEVDKKPPSGFKTELTLINKEFFTNINHYDLPSLYAGKLHAVLCRSYTKGRDYYDLLWYLTRKTEPNYSMLNQAISQTNQKNLQLDKVKLTELLQARINETDFKKIRTDIQPFLMDLKELRYFEKDFFLNLLKS